MTGERISFRISKYKHEKIIALIESKDYRDITDVMKTACDFLLYDFGSITIDEISNPLLRQKLMPIDSATQEITELLTDVKTTQKETRKIREEASAMRTELEVISQRLGPALEEVLKLKEFAKDQESKFFALKKEVDELFALKKEVDELSALNEKHESD